MLAVMLNLGTESSDRVLRWQCACDGCGGAAYGSVLRVMLGRAVRYVGVVLLGMASP